MKKLPAPAASIGPRRSRGSGNPADPGVTVFSRRQDWIPAFAGMTAEGTADRCRLVRFRVSATECTECSECSECTECSNAHGCTRRHPEKSADPSDPSFPRKRESSRPGCHGLLYAAGLDSRVRGNDGGGDGGQMSVRRFRVSATECTECTECSDAHGGTRRKALTHPARHSRGSGNPADPDVTVFSTRQDWIPAFAGMTAEGTADRCRLVGSVFQPRSARSARRHTDAPGEKC
jgi:hypothetical protein